MSHLISGGVLKRLNVGVQEEKIAALQSFADQLIGADHYAKPEIYNRRNEVLDRWERSDTVTHTTFNLFSFLEILYI